MSAKHFKEVVTGIARKKGYISGCDWTRRRVLSCHYLDAVGFMKTLELVKICDLKQELLDYISYKMDGLEPSEDLVLYNKKA